MGVMKLAAAAALLLMQGAASYAEPAARKEAPDPDKKTCRTETDIGSRLGGKRICRTAAEWAQVRAEARRTVERVQAGPSACLPPKRC